ncbi:MAG: thiamine biosynthesis protein ApbE [Pseudopedobacter saltans]|uniref:FAD:protein FMN transferase n=1 Tax=Pseudopedobacter saltans TaxID=151895 RepID=A0A2W5EN31_9SPHI|nr:MAG: thiamine biosynthesis protein ApbE [Pseudopedobacter saltans]
MMQEFQRRLKLMGNSFEITVVASDEKFAKESIDSCITEMQRIEKLLTTYSDDSLTNKINQMAGISPVEVNAEIFDLIERCQRISHITDGAFDISYGSVDKRLWNFDRGMKKLPSAYTAKKSVALIDYKNIVLDAERSTVFLKYKGMRIGFGGIGKGYAAEIGKKTLQNLGVESGIVNASGDMTVWGLQANGLPWKIGIINPDDHLKPFSYLNLTDMAIATSGNYEKYVIIDGIKYSHTINPNTGLPIRGIKSVTIITPNAEIADALTTPVAIMGIQGGLNLINQIADVECIIIDDNNQIYTSNKIQLK